MAIVATYDFGYCTVKIDDTYCKGITREESQRRLNEFGKISFNSQIRQMIEEADRKEAEEKKAAEKKKEEEDKK